MNCPECGSVNTANVVLPGRTLFSCAACLFAAEVFQAYHDYDGCQG